MRLTRCRNIFCGRLGLFGYTWVCDVCYPVYANIFKLLGKAA